jgi:hypothetical protein
MMILVNNQSVLVINRNFDTNQWRFTTNTFQAFDGKVSVRGIGMFCEETASLRHGADGHVWVSIQRWFEREAEDAAPAELERMFGLGSTRMPSLTGLKTVLSQVVEGQSLMR